jgi:hypothetical protein
MIQARYMLKKSRISLLAVCVAALATGFTAYAGTENFEISGSARVRTEF